MAIAGTTTVIPANSKRHSLSFATNQGALVFSLNGVSAVYLFTIPGVYIVTLGWDELGDFVKLGFSITWPIGSNYFFAQETYTEEPAVQS